MKTIVIGSDHTGFLLKKYLKNALSSSYNIIDADTNSEAPVDYPDTARLLASIINEDRAQNGILICGRAVGASVAANKIKGIRAGLCHEHYSAHQGVEHADMNVLVLSPHVVAPEVALELASAFLAASFSRMPGHLRCLTKITILESELHSPPDLHRLE